MRCQPQRLRHDPQLRRLQPHPLGGITRVQMPLPEHVPLSVATPEHTPRYNSRKEHGPHARGRPARPPRPLRHRRERPRFVQQACAVRRTPCPVAYSSKIRPTTAASSSLISRVTHATGDRAPMHVRAIKHVDVPVADHACRRPHAMRAPSVRVHRTSAPTPPAAPPNPSTRSLS
jgi:hypothetical protein